MYHDNYADSYGLSIEREVFSSRKSPIDLKLFKNYTQLKNYNTTKYIILTLNKDKGEHTLLPNRWIIIFENQ